MDSLRDLRPLHRFLLEQAAKAPRGLAGRAAQEFKISRQAVNGHLRRLVEQGFLRREGQTRSATYTLPTLARIVRSIPISADLHEDVIWSEEVLPILRHHVLENVGDICAYGFTEILNNAKDHSESKEVLIVVNLTPVEVSMMIADEGVGIFNKIKVLCGLEDERHALFELTKGKLTTDPEHHTGEGIFFTSRMFDHFSIGSGALFLGCGRGGGDWLLDDNATTVRGTRVSMEIHPLSSHATREIFDRYATDQDDYAFRRTHVVVRLAGREGEKLISRSQARRIVSRLEKFREVVFDFEGVDSIGPAFADEVFRVFQNRHPDIHLTFIQANPEVTRMIRRALVHGETLTGGSKPGPTQPTAS